MPAPVAIIRDLRLDLFRGLALWLIFLDQVPQNAVGWITPRNYGFSDAAEIFVFISGYADAYVYAKVMDRHGFPIAIAHIFRRAFQIYVAQIFLFMLYIAEIAYLSGSTYAFDDEMNVRGVPREPRCNGVRGPVVEI